MKTLLAFTLTVITLQVSAYSDILLSEYVTIFHTLETQQDNHGKTNFKKQDQLSLSVADDVNIIGWKKIGQFWFPIYRDNTNGLPTSIGCIDCKDPTAKFTDKFEPKELPNFYFKDSMHTSFK